MVEKLWLTPSRGKFNWQDMCNKIKNFIEEDNNYDYLIAVGTDSQQHGKDRKMVSSITVHRVDKHDHDRGHGAQYYYTAEWISYLKTLKQQIMYEASLTYQYKEELKESLQETFGTYGISVKPHSDIGEEGKTREFIRDVKAMFSGFGPEEDVEIKPYSYAASCAANRHTK